MWNFTKTIERNLYFGAAIPQNKGYTNKCLFYSPKCFIQLTDRSKRGRIWKRAGNSLDREVSALPERSYKLFDFQLWGRSDSDTTPGNKAATLNKSLRVRPPIMNLIHIVKTIVLFHVEKKYVSLKYCGVRKGVGPALRPGTDFYFIKKRKNIWLFFSFCITLYNQGIMWGPHGCCYSNVKAQPLKRANIYINI